MLRISYLRKAACLAQGVVYSASLGPHRVWVDSRGLWLAPGSNGSCAWSLLRDEPWTYFKQEKEVRKVVISAPEFRRRIGFAMTGLRDEIYLIGGLIGPDRFNWDIKPMSDVDILTVGGDRPTWRQAAVMTKCQGTILVVGN